MRELAKESGIAKGTIYYHFQDKRHIYLSVLERDINQVRDRLLVAVEQDGDFIHKLRLLIQTYFDLQRERRLVIMSALRENTVLGDKFSEILKKYRTELLQPIGALIREGMATGMVRPVDVELTVLSLLGILQGFVVHQLILENADIDNSVIDHIVSQFAHGIMVQGNSMLPTSEGSTSGGCTS
jgi:TetR/AcrR family transcriptional regulator